MSAWTDAITAETDWSEVDWFNTFVHAYDERAKIQIPLNNTNIPDRTADGAEGTEIVVGESPDSADPSGWISMDLFDAIDPVFWVHSIVVTINASEWAWVATDYFTMASGNADGFTAIYPAEFVDRGSDHYVTGEDVQNGDYARYVGDRLDPSCEADFKVYRRDGSIWLQSDDPLADQPTDLIAYRWYTAVGDYLTTHFFEERRTGWKLLLKRLILVALYQNPGVTYEDITRNRAPWEYEQLGGTWVQAKAFTEALFFSQTPEAGAVYPEMTSRGHWLGWIYGAGVEASQGRVHLEGAATWDEGAMVTRFYAWANSPIGGMINTFDNNHFSDLVEDAYGVIMTHTGANTGGLYSSYLGSAITMPHWCDEPPAGEDPSWMTRGFQIEDFAAVLDCTDVFEYQ